MSIHIRRRVVKREKETIIASPHVSQRDSHSKRLYDKFNNKYKSTNPLGCIKHTGRTDVSTRASILNDRDSLV